MVNNMAPACENAKYDIIWVSTSRIKGLCFLHWLISVDTTTVTGYQAVLQSHKSPKVCIHFPLSCISFSFCSSQFDTTDTWSWIVTDGSCFDTCRAKISADQTSLSTRLWCLYIECITSFALDGAKIVLMTWRVSKKLKKKKKNVRGKDRNKVFPQTHFIRRCPSLKKLSSKSRPHKNGGQQAKDGHIFEKFCRAVQRGSFLDGFSLFLNCWNLSNGSLFSRCLGFRTWWVCTITKALIFRTSAALWSHALVVVVIVVEDPRPWLRGLLFLGQAQLLAGTLWLWKSLPPPPDSNPQPRPPPPQVSEPLARPLRWREYPACWVVQRCFICWSCCGQCFSDRISTEICTLVAWCTHVDVALPLLNHVRILECYPVHYEIELVKGIWSNFLLIFGIIACRKGCKNLSPWSRNRAPHSTACVTNARFCCWLIWFLCPQFSARKGKNFQIVLFALQRVLTSCLTW